MLRCPLPKKLNYLCAPYSNENPMIVQKRMVDFHYACNLLAQAKIHVVSGLCQEPILKYGNVGSDWDYWKEYSELLISRCDNLIVLQGGGWQSSKGMLGEIGFGRISDKPIHLVYMDDLIEKDSSFYQLVAPLLV